MNNRLCILSIYDSEGIVSEYKYKLINDFKKVCKRVVLVINGRLCDQDYQRIINENDNNVYVRDNTDFDAGAYKYALNNVLSMDELNNYDELILSNDTFYGPFISWKSIFTTMNKCDCDFWGISSAGGTDDMPIHIQAYFMVIKKKMFADAVEFIINIPHLKAVINAVEEFEYKITSYFIDKGYSFNTYLNETNDSYDPNDPSISYEIDPYNLLSEYKCPILKRKAISVLCYESAIKALDYLKNYSTYDVKLIEEDVKRLDAEGNLRPYGFKEIDDFCDKYPEIYIYGNGRRGKRLANYLQYKNKNFAGFLVTKKNRIDEENVFEYKKINVTKNTGIIVGVYYPSLSEIEEVLRRDISDEQVIYPRV